MAAGVPGATRPPRLRPGAGVAGAGLDSSENSPPGVAVPPEGVGADAMELWLPAKAGVCGAFRPPAATPVRGETTTKSGANINFLQNPPR
mmetsp:Transcript_99266/g.266726  ORF Transcript_99266/g.266726 Transcript_99266/m.266726 type:complete len:90 (-) Transcript_99266:198-467(-)